MRREVLKRYAWGLAIAVALAAATVPLSAFITDRECAWYYIECWLF